LAEAEGGKKMTLLYIAIGGAIGSVLRYLLMSKSANILGLSFPYSTLIINVIGSCLMGVLVGYMAKTLPHSNDLRAFAAVGVLGGFTTFSAFSLDAVTLLERGELAQASIYVVASVVLSILALFAGIMLIRLL
jgi:CrcB protein